MTTFRPIRVRDCPGVLWALCAFYEGQGSILFEGDLSTMPVEKFSGIGREETECLRRQTSMPLLNVAVVPITAQNTSALKSWLSAPGMLGRRGRVIHLLVEANGEVVFSACDNFDPDCTGVHPEFPEALWARLLSAGLIRGGVDA